MLRVHTYAFLLLFASRAPALEVITPESELSLVAPDIVYYVVRSPNGLPQSAEYRGHMSLYAGQFSLWIDDWFVLGAGSALLKGGSFINIVFARDPIIFRSIPYQLEEQTLYDPNVMSYIRGK